MSRTISTSLQALKNTLTALNDNLTNIFTALNRKGVYATKTDKYEEVPGLISQVGNTFTFQCFIFSPIRYIYVNGVRKVYKYVTIKLTNTSTKEVTYMKNISSNSDLFKQNLKAGVYDVEFLYHDNTFDSGGYDVSIQKDQFSYTFNSGNRIYYDYNDSIIKLIYPVKTGVQNVLFNNDGTHYYALGNNARYINCGGMKDVTVTVKKTDGTTVTLSGKLNISLARVVYLDYDLSAKTFTTYREMGAIFN